MPSSSSSFVVIDCDYLFPQYAAAYLLVEGNRAAFIENNTSHAVPRLLAALQRAGLGPEAVDYVVITHVHLDHAGGSSALMAACPNATLLAHPRAARHVRDPSKIIAGAQAVYGKERFQALYGDITPVAATRVREMADEESLKWGRREWRFLHTRGHAKHHFCLWDSALRATFTGDAFGICYPSLQTGGRFLFASTSPTDFEAAEARQAARRIAEQEGDRAFLTHFGEVRELKAAAQELEGWIDFSQNLVEEAAASSEPDDALTPFCQKRLEMAYRKSLDTRGVFTTGNWELMKIDRELNAMGLAHAAVQARAARKS